MPAAAAAAAVDPTLLSWATRGRPPSITRAIEVHRLSLDFGQVSAKEGFAEG